MTRMLFTVCRRDCASILVAGILAIHFLAGTGCSRRQEDIGTLRDGFIEPPVEARPRALWDWVDGNFDLEEITQEMEEAARMGMGGFDIWDVCSVVDEDSIVPAGPAFMSDPSVEAICHAINEAERLGLDLGLIIASGWNAGGAWTLPEHQTMGLFHTDTLVRGPGPVELGLEFPVLPDRTGTGRQSEAIIPRGTDGLPIFYKEVALVAHRLEMKDTSMVITGEMVDLSDFRNPSGLLAWDVPPGSWKVTRYVCTPTGQPLFSHTPNSRGPMIDHFS
ncbi:MAG: hypothetical protein EHM46_01935, partial [Bacteroidetes bacterium]